MVSQAEWNGDTCSYAALNGNLDVLIWAKENGCLWDVWTCYNASQNNHLHILEWLEINECPCGGKYHQKKFFG